MKTIDLTQAIPETLPVLTPGGRASVTAVLAALGIDLPSDPDPASPGEPAPGGEGPTLGRFQLQGEIGRGGMGRVVEARDPELCRQVAVKLVIDPTRVTEARIARFVAEAQITSQLEHPNIVPVHEMGVSPSGELFFVMKKVEGRSLREVLRALRLGDPEARRHWTRHRLLSAFVQVCQAVAYAHDRGVLHRDIKPDNVMLGAFGEVLLMDWGLARVLGRPAEEAGPESIAKVDVAHTLDGSAVGTPGYMSPEQAAGRLRELDGRSDVWSLGAVLYELLTGTRPYEGEDALQLMRQTMAGPPPDPRVRAPERGVPEEIAEVCVRALAPDPEQRYAGASELADAVTAFLEGSRRRQAAARHVAEAREAWTRYLALAGERAELEARERELAARFEPWTPLSDKAELLEVRERLAGMGRERVNRFEEVIFACDQALTQDPGHPPARALLADVHYQRFEEAEGAGDEEGELHHAQRVRRWDDPGRYAARLRGLGAVTLRTEPAGAEVICERYERIGLVLGPTGRRVLGRTPLVDVALEPGSWIFTLRAPGRRDTRYPVFIPRGRHWDSGERPIPLFTDAELGAAIYVPAGPFLAGGDPLAQDALPRSEPFVEGFLIEELHTTVAAYCDFLNALAETDPEEAWGRVPRNQPAPTRPGAQYWDRPEPGRPYRVPERDRDGDRWDPNWPATSVSWGDAKAFAAWRAERDGLPWALPTELQWEKAARGTDGRIFPWGDLFDSTLAKVRDSRPGRPLPEPVGAFPTDASPYGVRDLAGSVRDWCDEPHFGGDPKRRPARGGAWLTDAKHSRAAYRHGIEPWNAYATVGFRLARPLPGAAIKG